MRRGLVRRHRDDEFSNSCRNQDSRYLAFDVKPGQKRYLAPEQRVKVW
jgi:predicted metalloendopeptidase